MNIEFENNFKYEVKYLSLGENAYREVLQSSPTVNERLSILQSDPKNVEARQQMLRAVLRLDYVLTEKDQNNDQRSYDLQLVEEVKQIALDMVQTLPAEKQADALKFINNLGESPWLFFHLDRTGKSIVDFFENTKQVIKGENVLLTTRQINLMEFVGRTHDIGKLLGSLNAQIDPDHEIIYREIIGKHLEGKTFITHNGRKIVCEAEDVRFIIGVVGLHEDIWREEDFAHQAESLKKENNPQDIEVAIARGRTILHFVDIFGDAVRFQDGAMRIVDKDAFQARFVDLFRRHIKLPIICTKTKIITVDGKDNQVLFFVEWFLGKVFRPQWGEHGVAGLTWTFGILRDEWGINIGSGLIPAVQDGVIQVLEEAEAAIIGVKKNYPGYRYQEGINPQDLQEELSSKLEQIKNSISAIKAPLRPRSP